MSRSDVSYFMANDAREVCLAFHVGHDAARHIDITTGQSESIDLRAVEHRKVPLQLTPMTLGSQFLAQGVDIALHRSVVIGPILLEHFLVAFGALCHFFLLVHDRPFALPGNGVDDGTATTGQQGSRQKQ